VSYGLGNDDSSTEAIGDDNNIGAIEDGSNM
jgi:hypothetical protein